LRLCPLCTGYSEFYPTEYFRKGFGRTLRLPGWCLPTGYLLAICCLTAPRNSKVFLGAVRQQIASR
jgi:hypothetical protein